MRALDCDNTFEKEFQTRKSFAARLVSNDPTARFLRNSPETDIRGGPPRSSKTRFDLKDRNNPANVLEAGTFSSAFQARYGYDNVL